VSAAAGFTWQDGERRIRFGRGALAEAPDLLGDGYVLLTTERAAPSAPEVVARASAVHHVPAGQVDAIAGDLLGAVEGETIAALGGGRVVDTAKALAAARPGRRAAAIPTTLSAAEMTAVHRHAAGVAPQTPRVRPALVVNDPALAASQPPGGLAASAGNSLGHAIEGTLTTLASPVPSLAGQEAARLIAAAYAPGAPEPDRDALALGALLSGYAIGTAWYGLHHVASQTLVREGGAGHGPANAALLPHTAAALRRRRPDALEALDRACGEPVETLARRIAAVAAVAGVRSLGVPEDALERCAHAAAQRPELQLTPPAADAAELLAIYREAW
jgi:alcohol dehydrogenase class IV